MNVKEAIRRLELLFDNNYYIDGKFILPIHARFELRNLWNIAFNEYIESSVLRAIV